MKTITQITKGVIYNRNGEKVIMTIIDDTYRVTNTSASNMEKEEVEESKRVIDELFRNRH